jgi:hypothetical protein
MYCRQRCPRGASDTYLLLLQHHKVEMPYAFIRVLLHPFPEGRLLDHLAYVLVYQASAASQLI